MSVEINVTDQIIEVTPTDAQIDVNITETPVVVDVTDQIIEIAETGLQGPQGPAGPGVPTGGTTGQILAKNSATNYDTLWINNATGTVTSVDASGISGISVSGGPITASGTLLITNTAPDQIVGLTGAGTTSISGTYPNFTITSNDQYAGTVTSVAASGGTGISVSGSPITSSGTLTIINTQPDQIVSLTGTGTTSISGTYPNFTINSDDQFDGTVTSVGLTAGTGINVSGGPITSSGNITVTNTAPDQVVAITGSGTTSVSGTYPNFNILSADQYTGTVTSISTSAPLTGGTITSSGTIGITQANSTTNGYLSSTDWNTFNNKQGALTLTTTGTSGAATLVGNTLNIPQYEAEGNYVTTATTLTINGTTYDLSANRSWSVGTVTSVNASAGTGISVSGVPITGSGTITITNTAPDQVVSLTGTGTTSVTGTYPNFTINSADQYTGTVTSVGLSMPSAFSVSNSPITGAGTINVTGAGTASQYIRGDGQLADFPTGGGGGGASVSYYLNGSVSQGTFGGNSYYEVNKTPIIGTGTDFSIAADGYIASFITDANDPAVLLIPGGNFNLEFYFSASSGGGTPNFYVELYKYDGTNFTLIASNSSSPELIAFGTTINPYFSSLAVPETILSVTDRLAYRIYVNTSGRTITLHTENSHLCQITTTFTTGLTALNGLTKQVQYLATGTSGSDFNISSLTDTHTFNLPTASAVNRGALSSADWGTFNNKENVLSFTSPLSRSTNTISIPAATSSINGYLTSADWTTFNGKQNAITLTTTGSSGASTFISNTLNIPNYTLSGLGGVPTTRTLTINGTAYDLSADRSWSVGTVTSVAALTIGTTGTDITSSVANGTTTPVITLNVPTASATNRGALSSADWSTFNGKQNAITLTTTGNSGSATLVGATLNIPTYTLAGLGGFANPMTTLGDIIYGAAAGAATRLAGNTTSTKQFLSQTGNGTVSAAPSWSAVTKTDVGLSNVENTALSTWAGSTNITTLGTISSGTWSASTIAVTRGGTGLTALGTAGQLLRVNTGATALEYFTPTYISGNQSITWTASGTDVNGSASGTTSITPTLTVTGLRGVSLPTLGASAGFLRYTGTGTNTWVFDTNTYLTSAVTTISFGTTGLTPATATSGAVTVAGTLVVANGGTGSTTTSGARTNLGATTVGSNLFTLTNPSAITFIRINADNTVSTLDAATFRTAIGAGTSSTTGTVTSVSGTGSVSGLSLSGTVTSSGNITLGGTLSVTPSNFASQTANTFLAAPNGTAGVPTFRTIVSADIPTLNQNTTGSAGSVTNSFIVRADSGTTEGTDIYTFNGSVAKNINFIAGSNISITKAAGSWTFAATQPTVNNGQLTLNVSGSGLSGSQTFTANQSTNATFTVTSNATSANTASTIVFRDTSGNFSAGTITASLSGNATTASKWQTARNITIGSTQKSVDGSANVSWSISEIGAFANPMTTLGDIIYGVASGAATRLAGNITTTKQFLSQTGTGTVSAAPSWSAVTKSDVGLANVENTALSTWAGSTNITTLGTISSGTWSASTIAVSRGGTGLTALGTAGQLLRVNAGATALEYFTPTYLTAAITSLNGLTAATQTFAVGTAGTDFAISSSTSTHTFNLPTASATNRGALSSADWTTFNNKQNALTNPVTGTGTTNYLPKFTGASTIGNSNLINDASGNLGLGATPSAWTTYVALQVTGASLWGATTNAYLGNNYYYNGNRVYISTGYASELAQVGGAFQFNIAPSGTAGTNASFTQSMTLNYNGNLLLGSASDDFTNRLQVTGSGKFTTGIDYNVLKPTTTATASTATLTPSLTSGDTFTITAQAAALSIANPTGTPVNGQKMIIRIKDNGTARAITWSGTQYRASSDLALPTTTIINKTMYLGFIWNSTDSKWDMIAFLNNF